MVMAANRHRALVAKQAERGEGKDGEAGLVDVRGE